MHHKIAAAIGLSCLTAAFAGEPINTVSEVTDQYKLPNMDAVMGRFTYSNEMDFEDIDGSLSVTEFDFLSVLSRPITVAGDIMLLPFVQYGLTSFDFDGVDNSFPIADEDLHSVSLHLAALKYDKTSPWLYGAWVRAELASDFQHINGDDFTFDVAGGVGYRYSDNFMIGVGGAVLGINGDTWFCPGINFDWVVSDKVRVGLYGPMPVVSYTPNDDWSFSLRGNPGGGIWNITDDNGDSKDVDLSSYQVGAYAGRRLTGKLWLNAGVGMTVMNNITYSDSGGDNETLDEDMDAGWFGQIGLSLKTW